MAEYQNLEPFPGTSPDFVLLADAYPKLKPFLIVKRNGDATIDFNNPAAQRSLTEAILWRDFRLVVKLSDNRLCPPVPNRLNYIRWLQAVLHVTAMHDAFAAECHLAQSYSSSDHIQGIDIGTGSSAIYPLLGCSTNPNWRFAATDIDDLSIQHAHANVQANGLNHRIQILRADPDGPIFVPLSLDPHAEYNFTMCNPPFYASQEDIARSAESKDLPPNAVCTGAEVEMITHGGEVAFVHRMVEESIRYGVRCRWYTSMLGKLSSVVDIVSVLKQHSIYNYAVTEFVQGQTRRWAIGWTFTDTHLPDAVGRLAWPAPAVQAILPPRSTLGYKVHGTLEAIESQLRRVLESIPEASVGQRAVEGRTAMIVSAPRNTWSRKARRARRPKNQSESSQSNKGESEIARLHVEENGLLCSVLVIEKDSGDGSTLQFQWMKGRDFSLFEAFCSHVARKVQL